MKKYKKVTDMEVLKKYCEIINEWRRNGWWQDYISINEMSRFLETSKYQIQRAYKNLKEKGFMEIIKVPVYVEEYDNGLYTVSIPMLFAKAYGITNEGRKEVENEQKNT